MAGAGYKLFTTGSVLTAAEVNTYLNEQTVMVFNDATARTTALSGVLAEGMVTYLKSTKVVEIYNGTAWASLDDPNAIQNTIVDAKGDLISATGNDVPARLAAGSNGDSLVVDSGTTTGLRWQGNYAAGKNKFINADFNINQRNFTSSTVSGAHGFDRWRNSNSGGTVTYTPETFTPGTAPVAGYEARNYARVVTSGQSAAGDFSAFSQLIEDVRTFAGQTATVSFWAKSASGTPKIAIETEQNFGSGGSPSSNVQTYHGQITISTSWTRYSVTMSIPSISGKTLGTDVNSSMLRVFFWMSAGTNFNSRTGSLGVQNNTFDIWGVQVEAGSVATAFQTATGTLAGELAACQRYYYRFTPSAAANRYGAGFCDSTTVAEIYTNFPVQMRTRPTALEQSGTATDYSLRTPAAGVINCSAVPAIGNASEWGATTNFTVASGLTAGNGVLGRAVNTSAYLGWSAEL